MYIKENRPEKVKRVLLFQWYTDHNEKTLTEEEVSASFNKVVKVLGEKIGAELR